MKYVVVGLEGDRIIGGKAADDKTLKDVIEEVSGQFWDIIVLSEEDVEFMHDLLKKSEVV